MEHEHWVGEREVAPPGPHQPSTNSQMKQRQRGESDLELIHQQARPLGIPAVDTGGEREGL